MTDVLLKETAGDTLQGAVNGVNTDYIVSFDFNPDSVNVYLNGRLKVRDWDDGFAVFTPRTISLKEAPVVGDSLEIEYKADILTGGGAEGGCPSPPQIIETLPGMDAKQNLPNVGADNAQPNMTAGLTVQSNLLVLNLRPVICSGVSDGGE